MSDVTLKIEGMSCSHCIAAVRVALEGLSGVTVGSVELGRAVVALDQGGPTAAALAQVVTDQGYPATVLTEV